MRPGEDRTLRQLPFVPERAVIINVGTKEVTTLALLSTLRRAKVPTVVIDCESRDGSFAWFRHLTAQDHFDLLSAPLAQHGRTLDWIFREIPAERVLLVDSDVELLNPNVLQQMRTEMERNPNVFGSGYLHPAEWLQYHYDTGLPVASGIGYYPARPWIPFTLLKVPAVQGALEEGLSFMHQLVLNDLPKAPFLGRILWHRFRFELFRRRKLKWLDPFRITYDRHKPAYVHCDTGTNIYRHLLRKGLEFRAVSNSAEIGWSVRHLGGVTRNAMHGEAHDAQSVSSATSLALEKLERDYGLDVTPLRTKTSR
jgi:hypothetical protein